MFATVGDVRMEEKMSTNGKFYFLVLTKTVSSLFCV
jgi:hypothetical protein